MSDHYRISEAQLERIKPCFPRPRGRPRVDDRRAVSGIFAKPAGISEATDTPVIDATHPKADRSAASLLKNGMFPAVSEG